MSQPPEAPRDLIRYDLLVQDALKGVVRKVLIDAGKEGLPGEHHFYVSFRTDFPGVRLSQRMREKYPEEMTIVLQHQFWDLGVTEHSFEVGLSFSGAPERLLIPFDAVVGFFDPSVQFGLKFELPGDAVEHVPADAPAAGPVRPSIRSVKDDDTQAPAAAAPASTQAGKLPVPAAPPKAAPAVNEADAEAADAPPAAQVVSLDAFRKKN